MIPTATNMVEPERIWPSGIKYGDVNPEGITSEIRLVRFTPQAAINGSRGGDIIKFNIQNDGFFDPFSAYLKIQVTCTPPAGQIQWLDRSAHSLISRLVIRSNGQELERIENYDVMAAMLNDAMYSPELMKQHHWEGFPTRTGFGSLHDNADARYLQAYNATLAPGSASWDPLVGEHAFYTDLSTTAACRTSLALESESDLYQKAIPASDYTTTAGVKLRNDPNRTTVNQDHVYHLGHVGGTQGDNVKYTITGGAVAASQITGQVTREFIIPIYSGLLGVLMPLKKFIPLAFIPLEIEFTLNPHAFYSSHTQIDGGSRDYTVNRFDLVSHVLYFDQEVKASLNNSLASYGLYMHCNSFASAVIPTGDNSVAVPSVLNIGMTLKSMNSVHLLFYYKQYESSSHPHVRKLNFVSHNVKGLQLRNGTTLIPSEPLSACSLQYGAGDTFNFSHVQFLVEALKAWGKLHNPTTDCMINDANYGADYQGIQACSILTWPDMVRGANIQALLKETMCKQSMVGRTQYAVNLEGEELGQDKSLITGRPAKYPFDIFLSAEKAEYTASYCQIFVRYDFLVQVRPDLLIQVSGR